MGNALSCQIIVPQAELGRQSDIYIMMISWAHCVAFKGPPDGSQAKYIAIVSATGESKPALDLLGRIEQQFTTVSDMYLPTDDGLADFVFVTPSYDATSHFESASEDVLDL